MTDRATIAALLKRQQSGEPLTEADQFALAVLAAHLHCRQLSRAA